MAKTRSKPATTTTATPKIKSSLKTLDAPVSNPPQLVVLPKDASSDARIVSIANSRYFVCPSKGFYEFKSISAPKSIPRSWLLAPDRQEEEKDENNEDDNGYVLRSPSILLATPIDPLFLLLPSLTGDSSTSSTEYLALSDFILKFSESSPHLTQVLRLGSLQKVLEQRIEAVCDAMDIGDEEKMYAFSLPKLVQEIVQKARRMASKPLPKSMEERFVKQALDVPVLSVRREEGGISVHDEKADSTIAGAEESQESTGSGMTDLSVDTAATSISTLESDPDISYLLRLRTSLDFVLRSYVPASLAARMEPLIASSIDWKPLTVHLEKVTAMKKEAQALRSIGENFSRKRALGEEDESREEAKKRKKEEEDKKKKNMSQGVRKLAKADRSGMKSLASFFGKK